MSAKRFNTGKIRYQLLHPFVEDVLHKTLNSKSIISVLGPDFNYTDHMEGGIEYFTDLIDTMILQFYNKSVEFDVNIFLVWTHILLHCVKLQDYPYISLLTYNHNMVASPIAKRELVFVLENGADKYGKFNWCKGLKWDNGIMQSYTRHFESWKLGEESDEESGLSHVAHMMANAYFLTFMMHKKPEFDDRIDYSKLAEEDETHYNSFNYIEPVYQNIGSVDDNGLEVRLNRVKESELKDNSDDVGNKEALQTTEKEVIIEDVEDDDDSELQRKKSSDKYGTFMDIFTEEQRARKATYESKVPTEIGDVTTFPIQSKKTNIYENLEKKEKKFYHPKQKKDGEYSTKKLISNKDKKEDLKKKEEKKNLLLELCNMDKSDLHDLYTDNYALNLEQNWNDYMNSALNLIDRKI